MSALRKLSWIKAAAVSGALVWASPATVAADTLTDALVGAYTHSGLLEQNRALLRAADEDVATAAAALRPIIGWSLAAERTFGQSNQGLTTRSVARTQTTAGISLELLLYDGNGTRYGIESAKEVVLATRQGLIAIEQNVLLRAVSAYMNLLRASEFVALRENNVRLITQELRAARDRFEVGEVTRTDVALAEARLAQARSNLATAQGDFLSAQEEYRNVVGHKARRLAGLRGLPRLERSVDKAKALAVRSHPSLLRAQHEVSAAELNIKRSEAVMGPQVSLSGSIGLSNTVNDPAFSETASIGLNLTQPIYRGGALSSAVRANMARRDAARGNLHTVRHNIYQDVGNAYARLQASAASLVASERQIRAARVAFQGVREEATLGARTTLDVLDAEQELLDAQASRISAQADRHIAAYTVLAAMGKLTAEGLNLPVQRYDPSAYYKLVKDAPAKHSKQGRQLDKVLRALGKE